MRVCILGAGGLGSVVGGYLARVGIDVILIGRPAHVEAIRRHGLHITGVRGEFHIQDHLTAVSSPQEAEGSFNYLILVVKGKDSQTALQEANGLRARTQAALSLQNSVVKDDILRRWIGPGKVLGAMTTEGATLVEPGHVHNHMTIPNTAYFGELNGPITPRVEKLTAAFQQAGLQSQATENIVQVEWEKLTQIATASGWSVMTLAAVPDLTFVDGLQVREGAEHYVQLSKELLSVYKGLGYTPQNFFAPISRLKGDGVWSYTARAGNACAHLDARRRFAAAEDRSRFHPQAVLGQG
ncbi:MAG: ketopantoate reductase family protein [Candidatus Binatia bacterium]